MNAAEKRIIKKYASIDDVIKMLENARYSPVEWNMPSVTIPRISIGWVFNIIARNVAEAKKYGDAESDITKKILASAIDEFAEYFELTDLMRLKIEEYRERREDKIREKCKDMTQDPMTIHEFNELFK